MTTATRTDGVPAPGAPDHGPRPWYRRRALLVVLAVVAVAAVAVITDLPVNSSRSDDISSARSVMEAVNTDLAPCAQGLTEAIAAERAMSAHTLSASDVAQLPALLRDDQSACSLINQEVFDLSSNIEVPGSSAEKPLGTMVGIATTWVTADALGAVVDVQTLEAKPGDPTALRNLTVRERQLAADRRAARDEVARVDRTLGTTLPEPDLPPVPVTSAPAG